MRPVDAWQNTSFVKQQTEREREREMIWGDYISWATWSHNSLYILGIMILEISIDKEVSLLQTESEQKVLSVVTGLGIWQLRSQEWAVAQSYSEAFSTDGYRQTFGIFCPLKSSFVQKSVNFVYISDLGASQFLYDGPCLGVAMDPWFQHGNLPKILTWHCLQRWVCKL